MLLILLTLCLRKPDGISHLFSTTYTFAGNGCIPEPRALRIGIANDTQTEVVLGDLTVGQQVITGLMASSKALKRTAPPGFGGGPRL